MNKDKTVNIPNNDSKKLDGVELDSIATPSFLSDKPQKYNFEAQRDDYLTPSEIYLDVLSENGLDYFDCDVCCTLTNIPALLHYKKDGLYFDGEKISDENGLTGKWYSNNWCNPPFPKCKDFIKKAAEEQKKGCTTFMLIPARTETKYWQDYVFKNGRAKRRNVDVKFYKKGICFIHPETKETMPIFKNALALITFRGFKDGKKKK